MDFSSCYSILPGGFLALLMPRQKATHTSASTKQKTDFSHLVLCLEEPVNVSAASGHLSGGHSWHCPPGLGSVWGAGILPAKQGRAWVEIGDPEEKNNHREALEFFLHTNQLVLLSGGGQPAHALTQLTQATLGNQDCNSL